MNYLLKLYLTLTFLLITRLRPASKGVHFSGVPEKFSFSPAIKYKEEKLWESPNEK